MLQGRKNTAKVGSVTGSALHSGLGQHSTPSDIWGRRRVLLLNATYEPLTALPLRRAVVLVLCGKADVVHDDPRLDQPGDEGLGDLRRIASQVVADDDRRIEPAALHLGAEAEAEAVHSAAVDLFGIAPARVVFPKARGCDARRQGPCRRQTARGRDLARRSKAMRSAISAGMASR